jgi:hypothetical protein
MANTTSLMLPLMAAAQAQKHVTYNEAILRLDAMVQLSVKDRTPDQPARFALGRRPLHPGLGRHGGLGGLGPQHRLVCRRGVDEAGAAGGLDCLCRG